MDKARLKRLIEIETSASDTTLKSSSDVKEHNNNTELARQDMIDALMAGKVLSYNGLTVMFRDSIEVYKYDKEGFFDRIADYEWYTVNSGILLRFMVTLNRI